MNSKCRDVVFTIGLPEGMIINNETVGRLIGKGESGTLMYEVSHRIAEAIVSNINRNYMVSQEEFIDDLLLGNSHSDRNIIEIINSRQWEFYELFIDDQSILGTEFFNVFGPNFILYGGRL